MSSIRRLVLQVKRYLPRFLQSAPRPSRTEIQIQKKRAQKDPNIPKQTALLVAYNGQKYFGNNFSWDVPTIEHEILKALHAIGATPPIQQDICHKMVWNQPDILTQVNNNLPPDIRVIDLEMAAKSFKDHRNCVGRTYTYTLPTYAFAPLEERVTPDYRISPEIIERVNTVMEEFWGSNVFHNFTSTKEAQLRGTQRHIYEYECGEPFIVDGVEFCVIRIWGQSFLLHQIRKMIGLTIAVVRGFCNTDAIHLCWEDGKMDIPKAPGLGLMLEKLHYLKYEDMFGAPSQTFPKKRIVDIKTRLEDFRENEIRAAMINTEIKHHSMLRWMKHLHVHTYRMVDRHGTEVYQRFKMIKLCKPSESKESNFLNVEDEEDDLINDDLDQTFREQHETATNECLDKSSKSDLTHSHDEPSEHHRSSDSSEARHVEECSKQRNQTHIEQPEQTHMEKVVRRKQSVES